MNGRNSYLVVGLFVSIGLVVLIAMTLNFAGGRSTEPNTRYTVLFERDISGLTLGAPVRFLGVGVGQVVGMGLTKYDGTKVRVDLEVLQSTPISTATYASLAFQGVTGVAFISLGADQNDQTKKLVADEFEYPVISTRNVGLSALLSDAPAITHKLIEILDRVSQLLDENNSSAISHSLANIERFTESLAANDNSMASLPDQLRSVLGEFEITLTEVRGTINRAEPGLVATMTNLDQASANLANISARLDGWLTENDRDVEQFISGGLGQMAVLITDTRNTIRELEKLLADLRANPSQLVYKPQSEPVVVEP